MAVIQGNLADGVPMQYGAYYNGQAWDGTKLLAPGLDFHGNPVSKEVVDQTNPANWDYLHPGDVTGAGMGTPGGTGAPTLDLQAVYNSAYNTPEIKAAQAEYDAKTKARDAALAGVNDNPFYVEGTRVGKQAKVNEAAENDLTRVQNQLAQLKSDAEIKVNIATKQYDINNQAYKDNLSMVNSLISSGGLTGATTADLAKYASITGMPVSLLQGVLTKQQQATATGNKLQTDTITSTDDKGNMTVAIIDTQTGKVIAKNSLGVIGKTTTAAEVVPFAKLSAVDQGNIKDLKNKISTKQLTREEAVSMFPNYAPYL